MRQGITTRYLGPTNAKGSRIKAIARKRDSWGPEQSLTDHLDHAQGTERNHTRVAHLLATKLGWGGLWMGGGNPEGTGFHYVNIGSGPEVHALAGTMERLANVDWFWVAPKD